MLHAGHSGASVKFMNGRLSSSVAEWNSYETGSEMSELVACTGSITAAGRGVSGCGGVNGCRGRNRCCLLRGWNILGLRREVFTHTGCHHYFDELIAVIKVNGFAFSP